MNDVHYCLNGVHYYVLLEWAPALMGVSRSGCLRVFFSANKLSLSLISLLLKKSVFNEVQLSSCCPVSNIIFFSLTFSFIHAVD